MRLACHTSAVSANSLVFPHCVCIYLVHRYYLNTYYVRRPWAMLWIQGKTRQKMSMSSTGEDRQQRSQQMNKQEQCSPMTPHGPMLGSNKMSNVVERHRGERWSGESEEVPSKLRAGEARAAQKGSLVRGNSKYGSCETGAWTWRAPIRPFP